MKKHFEDLTTIDCPFGMLDDDTQKRLRACERVERFSSDGWRDIVVGSVRLSEITYRAKPAPERRVEWANFYRYSGFSGFYRSRERADRGAAPRRTCCFRIEYDADTGMNATIAREEV